MIIGTEGCLCTRTHTHLCILTAKWWALCNVISRASTWADSWPHLRSHLALAFSLFLALTLILSSSLSIPHSLPCSLIVTTSLSHTVHLALSFSLYPYLSSSCSYFRSLAPSSPFLLRITPVNHSVHFIHSLYLSLTHSPSEFWWLHFICQLTISVLYPCHLQLLWLKTRMEMGWCLCSYWWSRMQASRSGSGSQDNPTTTSNCNM